MVKGYKALLLAICTVTITLSLCSCENYIDNTFYALDTLIYFKTDTALPKGTSELINSYERKLSRTLPDSYIYNINHGVQVQTDAQTYGLIKNAVEISRDTCGAFDVSCGELTELWDITSGKNYVPDEATVLQTLERVGYERISLSNGTVLADGVKLDLGGVAKGYIAQKTVEFLRENGVESGFASFGGNVAIVGPKKNGKPWSVGIKDPADTSIAVGDLMLTDGYVSVSGGYERYFEKDGKIYHHIFDSKTGYPAVTDILSATAVSSDGMLSDALSTAMFVMGKDGAVELYCSGKYSFEAVIITKENKMYISNGLKDIFVPYAEKYSVEYFGG